MAKKVTPYNRTDQGKKEQVTECLTIFQEIMMD